MNYEIIEGDFAGKIGKQLKTIAYTKETAHRVLEIDGKTAVLVDARHTREATSQES